MILIIKNKQKNICSLYGKIQSESNDVSQDCLSSMTIFFVCFLICPRSMSCWDPGWKINLTGA